MTIYAWLNGSVAAGYVLVAVVVQLLRFPLRWWRACAVALSTFFLGCATSHSDLALHGFQGVPLTTEHMGDPLHLIHTAVQGLTVWPAAFGLLALARWVSRLLAKIDHLESLVEEAGHRSEYGSPWGARPPEAKAATRNPA